MKDGGYSETSVNRTALFNLSLFCGFYAVVYKCYPTNTPRKKTENAKY